MLLDAATAASGAACGFLALGGRRAEIVTRLLELAGRHPLQIFRDRRIAMHADAAFGTVVIERDIRQHRFGAGRAVRHRKRGISKCEQRRGHRNSHYTIV